jgi:dTDP-4-dehydrorhamnose 3,5-epimerase
MKATSTALADVLIIEPILFSDDRGFLFESFNQSQFSNLIGRDINFVQDNHSHSIQYALRGLHYQIQHPQGKLIRVTHGEIWDVVIDMRQSSPTFGQHMSCDLSADNQRMLWIPEGFAHGFMVLSTSADVLYKTTTYWKPNLSRTIAWNDATLNIQWPIQHALTSDSRTTPILSASDQCAPSWQDALYFP